MLLFMLQPDCNMAGIALASELSDKALEYIAIFGTGVGCPASASIFAAKMLHHCRIATWTFGWPARKFGPPEIALPSQRLEHK
jgi:hypothetical protein